MWGAVPGLVPLQVIHIPAFYLAQPWDSFCSTGLATVVKTTLLKIEHNESKIRSSGQTFLYVLEITNGNLQKSLCCNLEQLKMNDPLPVFFVKTAGQWFQWIECRPFYRLPATCFKLRSMARAGNQAVDFFLQLATSMGTNGRKGLDSLFFSVQVEISIKCSTCWNGWFYSPYRRLSFQFILSLHNLFPG